ncbi:MAG TPA: glycosyltransferase [Allosphingosinicella sp.]|nr:glycosyltransferase [Allosphingosinicella sp.]
MTDRVQAATLRIRIASALFALNAVITIPWALSNWGASPSGILILGGWLALAALMVPIAREQVSGRLFWAGLAIILIVSRLAAYSLVDGAATTGDPEIYEKIARSLIAGEGLVFHDPLTGVDFRSMYPPLYPLLIAGLGSAFGLGAGTYLGLNIAVDLGSALLIAAVGARLGSAPAGRAASWLFAIWPAFIMSTPFAQKESLVLLEVLGIALILLRMEKGRLPAWWEGAAFGLLWACLMLTQPGLAVLPALLALFLLAAAGWRTLFRLALVAAPFAVALMLPWWVRNYAVLGSFVPLTTTSGIGLWIGNNPDATGGWVPMPAGYSGMPEVEMSRRAGREATQWIGAHPLDFIKLTLFKLFKAMGIEQFNLARLNLLRPVPAEGVFAAYFPVLQGSLVAVLAGTALLLQRVGALVRGNRLILVLLACAVQILVFSLPFEFGERHRYFLMPFLFLAVAIGFAAREDAREART